MAFLKASNQRFSQTMVMITHNPEIAQMANRIIRIEDGRIKAESAVRTDSAADARRADSRKKEGPSDVSGEK